LPPVAPSNDPESCDPEINPRGTGCIPRALDQGRFQAGDFTPDGNHVAVTVTFVGAPNADAAATIYDGEQLVLVKTDGTTFENGDSWKCLTCGTSGGHRDMSSDYPHIFRNGDKALWGRKYVGKNNHSA